MILQGVAGVLTGLVGNIFTAWNNRKLKALEYENASKEREHELKMIEAQTAATIKEVEANIRITETEIAGEIQKEELDVFKTVQVAANKPTFKEKYMEKLYTTKVGSGIAIFLTFLFGLADFIKAITRPVITVGLIILVCWMVGSGFGTAAAMLELVTYLATTCVVWWFGYRNEKKFNQQPKPKE